MTDTVDPRTPDEVFQSTCQTIVSEVAQIIDAEPAGSVAVMRLPGGPAVGKQIVIDATEPGGLLNRCRLAALDPMVAPAGEVVRIEYEHDKQTKTGVARVYSVQSLRMQSGKLVLLENFLADSAAAVREADFRPITALEYARTTVHETLKGWLDYRKWQLQGGKKTGS